ncbi:tetratricopeptide repeat protein [Desulfobacterales bacterium HSG2]|nr:tetratricopeptide repeat protein [Desulfobacterales bacterium HSG2]
MKKIFNIRPDFTVCLLLILSVLVVYWQVRHYEFISFDDNVYVAENRYVRAGLTSETISWAFSFENKKGAYWQPLTWLSHALDCHLYELNAGMHHWTSLIIHIANSILLFLVFRRMTGEVRKSAFVAALFALHPLNVDSVAWIAERKNVLSTFFWMLTMLAYVRYTEQPGFSRYMPVFLAFLLGLMTKPMLVTLPFVLLLTDYWPLCRLSAEGTFRQSSIFNLLLEKVPLFLLSAASVIVSSLSLQHYQNITVVQAVPMELRIANALISYIRYIEKMIWPRNMAFYYPYPDAIPLWQTAGAAVLLICVSFLTIRLLRRMPYLITGWLWYIGTLIPVSGLVQTGFWPAMADRWAYIPLIGIFVMIAWGVPEILAARMPNIGREYKNRGLAIISTVIILVLMTVSWRQTGYWANSITLLKHALDATSHKNYLARNHLAVALADVGKTDEAIYHYTEILRLNPGHVNAHNNLGFVLADQKRTDEAVYHYKEALRLDPGFAKAHNNLGIILAGRNKTAEAVRHFSEALRLDKDYAEAYYNLGLALADQGKQNEAIRYYSEALRLNPYDSEIYNNLGSALFHTGNIRKAVAYFQKALQMNPEIREARSNLNMALAARKNIDDAIADIQEELKLKPDNPELYYNLGNQYGKIGETESAMAQYRKALSVQPEFTRALKKLAVMYAVRGEYDKALSLLKKMMKVHPGNPDAPYYIACIYARQNKVETSVGWLKKAVEKGYENWEFLKTDSNLKNIRGSSYYRSIVGPSSVVRGLLQPTTNNRQPTTDNQQPTTDNQQPTTNNQQPTTNN